MPAPKDKLLLKLASLVLTGEEGAELGCWEDDVLTCSFTSYWCRNGRTLEYGTFLDTDSLLHFFL